MSEWEVRDCGCRFRDDPDMDMVRHWDACKPHDIRVFVFNWLHGEGHEDCCDLPILKSEMECSNWTVDDLRAALDFLAERGETGGYPQVDPVYIGGLLERVGVAQ